MTLPRHTSIREDKRRRYLPDNRKIGKSDVGRHDKPPERILKKATKKHEKDGKALLAPFNFGTEVR